MRAAEDNLVVSVPTVFAKETVERKYREHVARALARAHGGNVGVTFVVQATAAAGKDAAVPDLEALRANLKAVMGEGGAGGE